MDDETVDLIRTLCTRAGMIMEDASVDALLIPSTEANAISAKLARLTDAAHAIAAIVAAASVLNRSIRDVR